MNNSTNMKSKRRREDILTGILMSALKGSSKTRIMYDNGLNFRQLKQYLNYAVSNGLLEVREGNSGSRAKQIYFTTDTGIEYLRLYKKISEISSNDNSKASTDTLIYNNPIDGGESNDRE
jgi:predicted transcriptional regulator